MKKKITSLSVIGLVCIGFMLYAQSTPTPTTTLSLLTATRTWIIENHEDYDGQPPFIKFTDSLWTSGQFIEGELYPYHVQFYLSETKPAVFDSTKIGQVHNGKYIVTMGYDGFLDIFEILELTTTKLKLQFFGEGRYTGEGLSTWIAAQ